MLIGWLVGGGLDDMGRGGDYVYSVSFRTSRKSLVKVKVAYTFW